MKKTILSIAVAALYASSANAALVTNPSDPRNWQGATVGTFAGLYYGSDTASNRQLVVDNQLLDDGMFNAAGYAAATLISTVGAGGCVCFSGDLTGTGSYGYGGGGSMPFNGNLIDNYWFQTDNVVGHTVFDLGFQATKAAVFNSIDHGPLPHEAIESTVYLSNDLSTWTQAVTERVWLEGFMSNPGILWDGFTYAVGTGTSSTFRYASVIWGGPGALIADGDNEINGMMGLRGDFTPDPKGVPEPASLALLGIGLLAAAGLRRRKQV